MARSGNPNPHQARDALIKKNASVPRRERWLVCLALTKLKLRYRQVVQFWNPLYTGLRRRVDGGRQWLDFVIRTPYGMAVIMFKPSYSKGSNAHLFEKRALDEKKAFLEQKGIPYLVLSRLKSQQEYEVEIEFWLRKEKRKHEKQTGIRNPEP